MKHLSLHLIGFALAAFGASAQAGVYTVGSGPACTHDTIQAAIDAADDHPGADTVRITRSLSYDAVPASFITAQELTIEGGYATCTQVSADTTNTVITGTQLVVHTGTDSIVRVRRLELRDHVGGIASRGGAIQFVGDGVLEVSDSFITNNHAMYGGGIYAQGTGSNAELVIGANVVISNNTADYYGGGIYADQIEMSMLEPGSILMLNHAPGVSGNYGYGGGLYIHAGNLNAYAYIGSSGAGNLGAIWGNTARYGGGVALGGENDDDGAYRRSVLQLFSTDAQHRGRIAGNAASVAGGAVHMQDSEGGLFDGMVSPTMYVWNAELDDNSAPDGAAVYATKGSFAYFNAEIPTGTGFPFTWPANAKPCAFVRGAPEPVCGRIANNVALTEGGETTDGATLGGGAEFQIGCNRTLDYYCAPPKGGIAIKGNRGGWLINDTGAWTGLSSVLIADNQFSKGLIRSDFLFVDDSTIAGNIIGASPMLSGHDVGIRRSLLWQPGLTLLQHSGTMKVDHVMASEIDSLGGNFGGGGDCGGGVCAILADPMFVDPAHGDYTLRASSPAIDMVPAVAGDYRDITGDRRDYDLPFTLSDHGPRDIGAYERQSLQPMVLNGYFDVHDLRLWTVFSGAWDGNENADGSTGSGSWKMQHDVTPPVGSAQPTSVLAGSFDAGEQCVQLPGPGRYLLNGRGKGGGNHFFSNSAVLAWEYRRNGTADCVGTVDATGELTLSSSANWARPAQPAVIDVPEADFYASSPTIKVRLIGRSTYATGTMTVWFDGITMDLTSATGCSSDPDTVFCSGFEIDE